MGLKGKEEGRPGQAARPLPPSPNRTRKGGAAPPFFLSPSLLPSPTRQGRGVLLLVGVGLHLAHPFGDGHASPSPPLYTGAGGGGGPKHHNSSNLSVAAPGGAPPPPPLAHL